MKDESYYANGLARMIRCETVSEYKVAHPEKFERFHAVLRELFPLVFSRLEVEEHEGSLLLLWKGSGSGDPILLMSHQDVVAAGGNWKYAPFSGEIAEGRVWGRGTVDTKGSLYCIFQAVEELLEEDYKPSVDVYIASSCDEEVFGNGAVWAADTLEKRGVHLGFLLDEGGMMKSEPIKGAKGTFAMIGCLEKGTGNVKFVARSAGGHASAPGKGTALVRLGQFMADIEKDNPFSSRMNDTTIEMFRRLGPHVPGMLGFVMRHAKGFSPLLNKVLYKLNPLAGAMITTTLAFTTAHGSEGLNVLPEEAYVTGNMRFIHHEGPEICMDMLRKRAARYNVEVEPISLASAYPVVDYRSKEFRLVEDTVRKLFPGVIPTPYAMTGGTDARHFSSVTENAIRFAPLLIDEQQYKSIHGVDENISISVLPGAVEFYRCIIKSVR